MSEPTIFVTPPARIVWGHPLRSKMKTNHKNKQKVLDKQGNEIPQWSFGLAFERTVFEQQVLPYLQQEAGKNFPNGVSPDFHWKYKDGDRAIDEKGQPYANRDGYAGHYVLSASTELKAPEVYRKDQNGTFKQIGDNDIKTGDYVIAELSLKCNESPGIYVNPNMVCLIGQGNAIVGQESDPNAAFGNVNYQLPAGAQPLGAAPMQPGQAPMQPQAAPLQQAPMQPGQASFPGQPVPQQAAQMPQQSAPLPGQPIVQPATTYPTNQPQPQPAHDFVNNTIGKQGQ